VRKYQLSQAADKDLTDIYVYTHREFGEDQADLYFESLEDSLSKLVRILCSGLTPPLAYAEK
jgi:plasmid stabilization system protein ParE